MVKTAAILFGIVFLAIGILGFVPSVTTTDANGMPMLLGIFHVNPLHNIVHLASGVVALFCGMSGVGASRTYFRIFGIVYLVVAILGFYPGGTMILGMLSNNPAVTWLHVAIAVVSLYLGFVASSETTAGV
jgi:hypothetical protein